MVTGLVVLQILHILKKKKYKSVVANLSKQKALDANSGAIQQILFTGKIIANTRVIITFPNNQKK